MSEAAPESAQRGPAAASLPAMRAGYSGRFRLGGVALSVAAALALAGVTEGASAEFPGETRPSAASDAEAAAKSKRKRGAKRKSGPGGKPKSSRKRPRRLGPPPRSFFGIQSFETPSDGELRALRLARVGTYRITWFWPTVEHQPGTRDWSYYDALIARAALSGIRMMPVLYGTAPHLSSVTTRPPITAAARTGWVAFAADSARRYGRNGAFWRLNPALPYLPVRDWQVWNEPSSNYYWQNRPDAGEYLDLAEETRTAIRNVDGRARIVLGGLLMHRRDPAGIPMKRFLNQLYAIPGSRRAFDVVALHPYTVRPRKVLEIAQKARKVMRRRRDARTPLWITELGWSTGGVGGPGTRDVTTMDEQARKLAKTYALLKQNRADLRLEGVIWFVLRDYSFRINYWHLNMGLFTAQKAAKPAWSAFARAAGGEPTAIFDPPAKPPPPSPPAPTPPPDQPSPCLLLIFC